MMEGTCDLINWLTINLSIEPRPSLENSAMDTGKNQQYHIVFGGYKTHYLRARKNNTYTNCIKIPSKRFVNKLVNSAFLFEILTPFITFNM